MNRASQCAAANLSAWDNGACVPLAMVTATAPVAGEDHRQAGRLRNYIEKPAACASEANNLTVSSESAVKSVPVILMALVSMSCGTVTI